MQDIRNRIEKFLSEFGKLVHRRPWLYLLLSALAVIIMVSQIPHIRMDTSAEGILHKDDPTLMTYKDFRKQFGRDQMIIIALNPKDVFEPGFLHKLREFHNALEKEVPFVDEVTSLVNAETIRGKADDIIVEDLLGEWPLDENEIERLKKSTLENLLYRNILVSEHGDFTIVIIRPILLSTAVKTQQDTAEGKTALLNEEEISEFIHNVVRVSDSFRTSDFPVQIGGDMMVEEVLKKLTMKTMVRFTILTTLIIILVFAFLFRRISGIVLPFLVVNCSLYSTLGLMAAFGIPVTLNTSVLPSFLMAVGISDSVHILTIYYRHYDENRDKAKAISFALGHSGLAVIMTSLTTAVGLLSFATSGVAPVANLGIFAAIGVMLALLFTLVTLPALLALTPLRERKKPSGRDSLSMLDGLLVKIGDFATGRPLLIVICSICIFFSALFLALQLKFSHNSLNYLNEKVPVRMVIEMIDRELKGSVNVEILVDTGKPQGLYAPGMMKRIEQAQRIAEDILVDGRAVGRASAVTDIIKEINRALHNGRDSAYKIPGGRDLIAQELLLYEVGGGNNLDRIVDRDYSKARITVRVPWVDAIIYNHIFYEFEKEMQVLFDGQARVEVTGLATILIRTLTLVIMSMAKSYLLAGSIITVLMILLLGNVRLGLCSMAPNFLPIVLGLGFMKLASIPLDYSTIMVGGIAIGLAVDDTVHFMHNFRRFYDQCGNAREAVRMTLTTSGRAMLFTTIILGAGFFILILAELRSTSNFGLITGFTICMALIADFLLAPAMMMLLTRKKRL